MRRARATAPAPLLAGALGAAVVAALAVAAAALGALDPQAAHGAEDRLAVISTDSGRIVIEFFADDAPGHVDNFVSLAESGFYDGTVFHRIIPGFMIQGGDPNTRQDDPGPRSTWGMGGPDSTVDAEFNDIRHDRGIVSMARSMDPNSAGSQFFIVHSNSNFLDGQYTAFGRVATADSLETLDAIAALPTDGRDAPETIGPAVIRSVAIADRDSVDGVEDLGDPARVSAPAGPPPGMPPAESVPDSGPYTSEEFGVSFDVPEGWFLQLTGEEGAFYPDIALIGQAPIGGQPQAITIAVDPLDGATFEEMLEDHAAMIQESLDAGQLVIESRDMVTVGGVVAQRTDARSDLEIAGQQVSIRFREVVVAGSDDFYAITYSSIADQFADSEDDFAGVVSSFTAAGVGRPAEGAGGCLIATAVHGTELAPQVQLLREVRDGALAQTAAGSAFVGAFNAVYYAFSPAAADAVRAHPAAADAVRAAAAPLLSILSIASLADGQQEWQTVALAALAAALAVGAYIAAPAAAAALVVRGARSRGRARPSR